MKDASGLPTGPVETTENVTAGIVLEKVILYKTFRLTESKILLTTLCEIYEKPLLLLKIKGVFVIVSYIS